MCESVTLHLNCPVLSGDHGWMPVVVSDMLYSRMATKLPFSYHRIGNHDLLLDAGCGMLYSPIYTHSFTECML